MLFPRRSSLFLAMPLRSAPTASLGQQTQPSAGSAAEDEGERLSSLLPDTLVRIPVEQDHGQVSTTATSGNHNATEGVEGSAEQ